MRSLDEAHWRDSARLVRFFIWDGKTAFPLVLVILYPRLWTLIVAVVAMLFFTVLNRYGFTINVFLRWLRSSIAGRRKIAIPWWDR